MLDEGSRLYVEAMRLMKTGETYVPDFRKAVECFIKGANLFDKFCIERLKEILKTPLYRNRLSLSKVVEIEETIQTRTFRLSPNATRGVFGINTPRPIDHAAGMTFQNKK